MSRENLAFSQTVKLAAQAEIPTIALGFQAIKRPSPRQVDPRRGGGAENPQI